MSECDLIGPRSDVLEPILVSRYDRSTLPLREGARVTFDVGLTSARMLVS